jgi:hypothetical protein
VIGFSGRAKGVEFDRRFFLLINFTVGGEFAGHVGLKTVFPLRIEVDYVRVFAAIRYCCGK